MEKKLAILCSGGDCQGMNACIKAFAHTCLFRGIVPIGVNRGYQGLIDNDMCFLDEKTIANIDLLGGTILKVSRCDEFKTKEGRQKAAKNLLKNQIDGLVIIGGNGSFAGAVELQKEGIKLIAIPGTIDNDLFYTDQSLGFDTAVNNAVNAIENMMQTISANDRGLVVEVMGRGCGDIAMYSALCLSAHALATKEENTTISDIIENLKKCINNGVTSPLVIISENVSFSKEEVELAIKKHLNIDTRSCELGYIQRGGTPSVNDRLLATQFGILAVTLLESGESGLALGINDEKIFNMPLTDAVKVKQRFRKDYRVALSTMYNL